MCFFYFWWILIYFLLKIEFFEWKRFFIYLDSENDIVIMVCGEISVLIEKRDFLGYYYVKNVELLFLVLKYLNVLVLI